MLKKITEKRLLLVLLILCFVYTTAGFAQSPPASSAKVRNGGNAAPASLSEKLKHPLKSLAFSADFRVREEYFDNAVTMNSSMANHENNYQRYRFRFGATFAPFKDLDISARIITERRSYLKPDSLKGFRPDEFLFDNLYATWRNAFVLPVKITVGRQDMNIGSSWLVGDATAGDGSRTFFFDAARATIDLEAAQTTIDLIGIMQPAYGNKLLPIFHNLKTALTEQNENGFVANVSNKSLSKTQIDLFFIYKHNSRVLASGDQGHIFAAGGKFERELNPHLKLKIELAPEWGKKNGLDFHAFGANNRLTYSLHDKYDQKFRMGYEYLSGDNPSTKSVNEAFDILWGRWPQWGDLYVFAMVGEKRVGDWTNLHRLDFGWTIHPAKSLEVFADYMPLFAPQNPYTANPEFNSNGKFRGHLFMATAQYAFNKHIVEKIQGEFFSPGSYYAPGYRSFASFIRAELMFAW